jgi:DNA-binding transcriptional ArsR family regulator
LVSIFRKSCVINRFHMYLKPIGYKYNQAIMRRDVFQAIADPTRRAIINMIAHKSLNLNSVAESFNISRPAISKHIKILTQCGLITIKQQGRERYCQAKLQKLNEVSQWIEQYRVFWTSKLDALENFLALEDTDNNMKPIKKRKRK